LGCDLRDPSQPMLFAALDATFHAHLGRRKAGRAKDPAE
jgi:hypothetical protein